MIWEAYKKPSCMYHVTPSSNVQSILKNGLLPKTGDNSSTYGEKEDKIYLFPTEEDASDALSNWLGDQYEDDDIEFSLLQVNVSGLPLESEVEYEYYTRSAISPDKIKVLKTNY
jgi:hypothetical protein